MAFDPIYEQCKQRLDTARADIEKRISGLDAAKDAVLVSGLEASLTDIDAALARLEAGTYGICESCGGKIGFARVYEMPTVRICIKCAGGEDEGATLG